MKVQWKLLPEHGGASELGAPHGVVSGSPIPGRTPPTAPDIRNGSARIRQTATVHIWPEPRPKLKG